jgi:hypothetical protein
MAGLLEDYWSLDAARAEGEKVMTQFNTEAIRLGFLDPSSLVNGVLPEFTKLELPLWLARPLQSKNLIKTFTPAFLSRKSQNLVEAQAREMDLRALSAYYYEVGQMTFSMNPSVEAKSIDSLLTILTERHKEMFNQAQHAETEDVSRFVAKLTSLETNLYKTASECARDVERWKKLEITRVESETGNKRRRMS